MTKSLSESDILLMFAALAAFVALARLFGDLAARFRQPQVLGEILAGVVVGPSLLGLFAPGAERIVARSSHILEPISAIGIVLLLALTGMETDFAALRRNAGPALLSTIGGVVVPLAAGFAFGMALPDAYVGSGGSRLSFALFLALAMSISAVTVIAKVLVDLGQMRRSAARIILTGGIFDETLGWILLALISGFATATVSGHGHHPHAPGGGEVLPVIFKAVAFLVGAAFFGRRIVNVIVSLVRDRAVVEDAVFTVTIVLALASAAITEALGLHQILGAFVFGVIAGTIPRIDRETVGRIRIVTRGFLVPLFFLFAGMKVDLGQLGHRDVLLVAAGFIAIALLGKIVGCTLGGVIARMPIREALLIGVGMSARGSMEIVLAVLGLGLGILSPAMFSVIVLLSVVTIVIIPAALRFAFAAVPPSEAERKQIEREELDEASYTPGVRRVLVPLLPSDKTGIGPEAARALARSKAHAAEPLELVMLRLDGAAGNRSHDAAGKRRLVEEVERTDSERPIEIEEHVVAVNEAPQVEINDAVQRGYQLAIIGVPANTRADNLFGNVVNDVIRNAGCDVLIVWADGNFDIDRVKNIVVPLTSKDYARAGGDFAISLASGLGASVRAINIVRRDDTDERDVFYRPHRARTNTDDTVAEMRERAELLGVAFESTSRSALNPSRAIIRELRASKGDLCVLGASDQSRRGRPFFGDTPDALLRSSVMPVGLLIVRSEIP